MATPVYLRDCLEGSLRRLKTDVIDLWQLHRIDPKFPLADQVGVFADAVQQGKARHIGLSEVTPEQLAEAQKIAPIATVQNRYNLADREWQKTVDVCAAQNIGFLPWFPLATGRTREAGKSVGSDGDAARGRALANGARVASATRARDATHSRHGVGRAPRGKHRRRVPASFARRNGGTRQNGVSRFSVPPDAKGGTGNETNTSPLAAVDVAKVAIK